MLVHGDLVGSSYTVRDEIARFDAGIVYEAKDMLLDRLVAIKLQTDPSLGSMMFEARHCAAVRDECAASVYGMGTHQGAEYIVGERVTGTLLHEVLQSPLLPDAYMAKLRKITASVARAHEAGIAVGDISGSTILVGSDGRIVLGRLSLSQVPSFGPHGRVLAPELAKDNAQPATFAAAAAVDLYGLGCIAIELACGEGPFTDADLAAELRGHAQDPPPRLADLRSDLPGDLSDLVEWMLAKHPSQRPPSAAEVLSQIDAIRDRAGGGTRTLRVLIVDDDTARARWMYSLARRAYSAAHVEIASEGTDAAHKLNRDHPDIVFIDGALRGVMNALELIMYIRGLQTDHAAQLVAIGAATSRDRALFENVDVPFIEDDESLANAIVNRVRTIAQTPPRRRRPRVTVSG